MTCHQCNTRPPASGRIICNTCKSANYAAKNPLRVIYLYKKADAKKRGLDFTLTLEHLKVIAEKSGLLNNRGRGKDSLTLHRINNDEGYHDGGVAIISKSENSSIYWEEWRKSISLQQEPGLHLKTEKHTIYPF